MGSFWQLSKFILLLELLYVIALPGYGHSDKENYKQWLDAGEYDKALGLALDSLELFPIDEISNEKAEVLKDLGYIYSALNNFAKSSDHILQAIEILNEFPGADLNLLALCHNNLAYAYDWMGYSNRCIDHYEKAFELWSNNYSDDYWNMATIFNNLRDAFVQYGDLKRGRYYMDKFAEYTDHAKQNLIEDELDLLDYDVRFLFSQVTFLSNIPEEKAVLQRWDELKVLYPTVKRSKLTGLEAYFLASLENIGFMYKTMGKYDLALSFYDEMKSYGAKDFFEMKMDANKAIVYYQDKQWHSSLSHCNKALRYFEKNKFGVSELVLKVLKAEVLFRTGEVDESKVLLADIYGLWTGYPIGFSELRSLDILSLQGKNNIGYIDVLIKSANTIYEIGLLENDNSLIQIAYNFYTLASQTFEAFYLKGAYNPQLAQKQSQISDGLLTILTTNPNLIENGIMMGVNQIERNESQQFVKEFLSKNIQNLSGSFELIRQKNDLILTVKGLEDFGVEDAEDLIMYRLLLDSIEGQIGKDGFMGYANDPLGFDISRIQQMLKANELVLKYYLTDKNGFLLGVEGEKIHLFHLGERDVILKEIFGLKEKLIDPKLDFKAESKVLFRRLIPDGMPILGKKLVIIPHAELSYIPFETLMDAESNHLLETNPVSYSYSLKFFEYRNMRKKKFDGDFLASYAPAYDGSGYSSIKNNRKEASLVGNILGGSVFLNTDATKKTFISNMTQFKIHHLALHAEQDDFSFENSALVFSGDEKLFFHELYNLNFPADLVVLSACNTGVGSLEPGLGLMGLGRALTYSGVGASVYSLWPVSDKETSVLMEYFYQYLKNGFPKDEALRLAKIDFVKHNSLKTHPYFWAGFVLNGDTSEVTEANFGYRPYLFAIFSAFVMFAVFWFWKKGVENRN